MIKERKIKKKSKKEIPTTPFLVCKKRRNRPQVSPQICEKKCRHRYRCPAYFDYLQPGLFDDSKNPFTVPPREEMRRRKKGRAGEPDAEAIPTPPPRLI
jgi:hypothetical protein